MKKLTLVFVVMIMVLGILGLTACEPNVENYKVSFDWGFDSKVETKIVESGTCVTPPTTINREGYRFVGWQMGGKPYDLATPVTGDIMLRADWQKLTAVDIVTDGVTKRVYLEPRNSYTMADFDVTVDGMTVTGFYSISDGKASYVDLAEGLDDGSTIYVDYMSAGLVLDEIDGTYTLTSINKDANELVLPRYVDGKKVVSVGNDALHNVAGKSLARVELGGIETIGVGAFSQVVTDSVVIPSSVTKICRNAFARSAIDSISFENGGETLDIEERAFSSIDTITAIKIPARVEHLRSETFIGCTNLKKAYIPNSVTDLEKFIFRGCIHLENVYRQIPLIPDNDNPTIAPEWNFIDSGVGVKAIGVKSEADLKW